MLQAEYHRSNKRVFLLDYDGTLSPVASHPSMAVPSADVIKILENLSNDPNNHVYVISGRDIVSLTKWLGHLNIGLSAEHGAFFRDNLMSSWEEVCIVEILRN